MKQRNMDEAVAMRYWCYMCSQRVDPVMEAEIKCPFCQSGFIEEMGEEQQHQHQEEDNHSLWAPILMEIMNDPVRRRRNQSVDSVEETVSENEGGRENNLDWQLQEIVRRRRRHSAAVLQLLQGIQAGVTLEGNGENRDRERVILINPFNHTITVQTDSVASSTGSLGDYFIGPGFEALLQRLAENDPNRYGTPPAKKEAVEALETVKIEETLQCSVCLEDFEIGSEAKQMPCKHNFHGDCLFPWLELHSSCPVCRYQLPADEPKTETARTTPTTNDDNSGVSNGSATSSSGDENTLREEEENEEDGDSSGFAIPWPFNNWFTSSHDSNATSRDAS